MASYNLMKAEDRARFRADRKAELDAITEGRWPRDTNDAMRWTPPTWSDVSPAEYAAKQCRADIAYIDGLNLRLAVNRADSPCF